MTEMSQQKNPDCGPTWWTMIDEKPMLSRSRSTIFFTCSRAYRSGTSKTHLQSCEHCKTLPVEMRLRTTEQTRIYVVYTKVQHVPSVATSNKFNKNRNAPLTDIFQFLSTEFPEKFRLLLSTKLPGRRARQWWICPTCSVRHRRSANIGRSNLSRRYKAPAMNTWLCKNQGLFLSKVHQEVRSLNGAHAFSGF